MPANLIEFHAELFQDVQSTADAGGQYIEDAFFELFCNHLIDAGELETADRAYYTAARGMRADGYGGDPRSSNNTLSLIIADFQQSAAVTTLTAGDMDALFTRLFNFLKRSLDQAFRDSLEESSAGFGLADLIAHRWPTIAKVRLILISTRVLSTRVDGREAGEHLGIPVTYSVWDLGRLHRFVESGRGREEIEVDLENEFGGALPALPAFVDGAHYQAYLVVISGTQLAKIYDRWGARLLEQNVRVFLQARGGVNRGIRYTLENEPEMFLAYNNGITATAESIASRHSRDGLLLTRIKNLQIVNGGQTTASIHSASRDQKIDLSRVFVQMKLSIVDPTLSDEIVPKISEYANSQNRVNAADFFANHPVHIRMQDFSRRLLAPSPDGTFRESKWFYERARGQYQDAKANLTSTARNKFELDYPKRQVFSKTDLAKFLNVWLGQPHIVSRGTQKNFASFAQAIGREWTRAPDGFNESYFREAIAKAIIFRATEDLVSKQPWYQGGYRANIVAYAIAKIAHDLNSLAKNIDFERIWREQRISPSLTKALEVATLEVNTVITDTSSNVTEWAKQQACWSQVAGLNVSWPPEWIRELIGPEQIQERLKAAVKDQKMLNGIQAQTAVLQAGGEVWQSLRQWGLAKGSISPTEADILAVAASVPNKIPSEKQSILAVATLMKLRGEGCEIGATILNPVTA